MKSEFKSEADILGGMKVEGLLREGRKRVAAPSYGAVPLSLIWPSLTRERGKVRYHSLQKVRS